MNAVRETAAPWFLRQAEFDGITIVLKDTAIPALGHWRDAVLRFQVGYGARATNCDACEHRHIIKGVLKVYDGDSLEEAEAAYADLERKLLAGELA